MKTKFLLVRFFLFQPLLSFKYNHFVLRVQKFDREQNVFSHRAVETRKKKKQAGAELGQAQAKLGLAKASN
jgi:hypothetical protein